VDDCRELMRGGSRSFFAASRLLPARYRSAATALYAFCRVADDEIDEAADHPAARSEALARLYARLDAIYAGEPQPLAADRAFARVVDEHRLPRAIPAALLEGFAWDAEGRRYPDVESLLDYCARVAGTVGAMMALIMGVRDERAMARACELGVAMQLTNIARDVGEDARMGRIYLPIDWLRAEGLDPQSFLERPVASPALGRVIARVLALADTLYRRAEEGLAELPRSCRPAILAARLIYADIGLEIRRAHHDSVSRRAVVGGPRKLARLLQCAPCLLAAPRRPRGHRALPAIVFLVEAARPTMRRHAPRTAAEKAAWMVDLFLTLAERERTSASGQPGHPPG
jgi:phytoene synthase